MQAGKKIRLFKLLGLLFSTLPPALVALHYFPLWLGEEKTCISLISVLLLLVCAIPLRRTLREALKTPSPWMCWLALWLVLTAFEHIARGVRAVALAALPFSIVGAFFFYLARREEAKEHE